MKKIKVSLLALSLVAAASGQAKVYLGAGVGYARASINTATTMATANGTPTPGPNSANAKAQPSGAIFDLHVGNADHINPDWFVFEQLAFQFDTVKGKKDVKLNAATGKQTLDRMYNISASLGLGYKVAPTWNVYGKVGVANAAFKFAHRVSTGSPVTGFGHYIDYSKTRNVWGALIGAGVNKSFDSHTIGLDYEYTRYQASKFSYVDGAGVPSVNYTAKTKNTAYHAVMVKFSKSF